MKNEKWSLVAYHSFMQMLTMLTATVLVGTLAGLPIPTILFTTGIGSIIFTLVTKGRVPIGLGTSGAWLGSFMAIAPYGIDHVVGLSLLGGLFYILFALLIKWKPIILKAFTPHILNYAVLFIALNLIGTGAGLVMGAPVTGIVTIISIILFSQFSRTKQFAFPIGIIIGTLVHGALYGLTSTATGIFIPTLVIPAINTVTLSASIAAVAICQEALGDSKLVSEVARTKYEPDKVILGNGIASVVAGIFGGMSVTTYSESCGYVRATGYANPKAIIGAGLLFMVMSFIPPVNYVIGFIPQPALAGLLLYLFSLVAASKIDDIKSTEGDSVVGIAGICAFFLAPSLLPNISQIAVAMMTMLVVELVLVLVDKLKK